jgi:hypothetical protein
MRRRTGVDWNQFSLIVQLAEGLVLLLCSDGIAARLLE